MFSFILNYINNKDLQTTKIGILRLFSRFTLLKLKRNIFAMSVNVFITKKKDLAAHKLLLI